MYIVRYPVASKSKERMQNLIAFQAAIAASSTPQNLPSNPVANSITLTNTSASDKMYYGNSSANAESGTGAILLAGDSVVLSLPGGNTNQVWVSGTESDVLSVGGS